MFGLDDKIAELSTGASVWVVLLAAVLLGLRHASDPDHLAAVTSLVAGGRERAGRAAAKLGLAWGLGHATTLFAFGMPIVLFNSYLPERVVQAAEVAIAFVIVGLAARLLYRWRKGPCTFTSTITAARGTVTSTVTRWSVAVTTLMRTVPARRSARSASVSCTAWAAAPASAFSSSPRSSRPAVAAASLVLLAVFTAVSMTILSSGFGRDPRQPALPCRVQQDRPGARARQPRLRGVVRPERARADAVLLLRRVKALLRSRAG